MCQLCDDLVATALAEHRASPEEYATLVAAIRPSDEDQAAFLAALDDGGDAA